MSIEDLFDINEFDDSGDTISAEIKVDKSHEVFKGHFPFQSILPGVTYIVLIKMLLTRKTGKHYFLKRAKFLKFLYPLDPDKSNFMIAEIILKKNDTGYSATAIFFDKDIKYCKIKAELDYK